MSDAIVQGDAFALPFRDGAFDVVVADPPYDTERPCGKRIAGKTLTETGYATFRGRGWWPEAWRVLRPDGHLYVFALIKELGDWLADLGQPEDVIAWVCPNASGIQSSIRRNIGGRALAWRPILHYRKGARIPWGPGNTFVAPNYFVTPQIQSNMNEAIAWPNQLPVKLLAWLLTPHPGARVLDVFAGTGTTREAALGLGLDVVSLDLSPEAVALTRRRQAQLTLKPHGSAPRGFPQEVLV